MVRKRSAAVLSACLICTCVAAASGGIRVYLRFAPQESINSDPPKLEKANLARPIRIGEIVDRRGFPDPQIMSQTPSVRAGSSIPAFISSALTTCLTSWGVRLATDSDVILSGEIATFTADEGNRYNAEINIRFRLAGKDGAPLWEGVATGHASTWGRSMSAANYNQVLSDAMRLLSAELVSNTGFQAAWSGQVASSSTAVVTSTELKAKILELMKNGVASDVIAGYVRSRRLSQPLTADEILAWKKDGISDEVIKAALPEPKARE